jgi:predicted DNA-binding ribbon-helix-helix protein
MKFTIPKRAIVIHGRRTSVSLEAEFWTALKGIAAQREMTLSDLVTEIDVAKNCGNLSSAIRLYLLGIYRAQVTQSALPQPERLGGERAALVLPSSAVFPNT